MLPNDDQPRSESIPPVLSPTLTSPILGFVAATGGDTQPHSGIPVQPPLSSGLPMVPGYTVRREVARGGMGVVYAAHDPTFDREVAIKVMHPGQDAGRFVVESKVTARLPHPGIPPVYALGMLTDGRPFLAMKLIDGCTLADELETVNRETALPHLLGIFEQICLTVGFAHSRGIVHRDLKPSNVMVGRFGEVLVMDWGLAKQLSGPNAGDGEDTERLSVEDAGLEETVAGQIKGTPAFMAPEQARGEAVDVRIDVFALGGILAMMLTGKPPFSGILVIEMVQRAACADLAECFGLLAKCGADAELIAIVKGCLGERPDDRFAHGKAVAEAVAAYRIGVEERLRKAETERVSAEARIVEYRKRRRVQLALVCAVASLIGLIGLGAWWQSRQEEQRKLELAEADTRAARSEADRLTTANEAEVARAKVETKARKTVQRQVIDLSATSGLTAAREGDQSLALLWFARSALLAKEHPEQDELNRIRIANWLRQVSLPEGTFSVPGFQQNHDRFLQFQFSPDGNYLVVVTSNGHCLVWDRPGAGLIPLSGAVAKGTAAAWQPESGLLAVATKQGTIHLLKPPDFQSVESIAARGSVVALGFSRDGKRLAWGGTDGARVWDCEKKANLTPLLPHEGDVVTVSFSFGGDLLATSTRDHKARVFRLVPEQSAPLFPPVPHAFRESHYFQRGPVFVSGDQLLVTVAEGQENESRLIWRSSATGQQIDVGEVADEGHIVAIVVDRQGKRVAGIMGNRGRLWDAQTRQVLAAIPRPAINYAWHQDLVFSEDGKMLATCGDDSRVGLWSVDDLSENTLTAAHSAVFHSSIAARISLTSDSQHLATALVDGQIHLSRLPSGTTPAVFSVPLHGGALPALSPDGRFIMPRGLTQRSGTQSATRVYEAETGRAAGPTLDPSGILLDAVFSPDGTRVATASSAGRTSADRMARLFQPAGKGGNIQIWDWQKGERVADPIPMPAEPRGLAFRHDGGLLAAVCADYRVVLVNARTGAIVHELDPGVRTQPWLPNQWFSNGEARFNPNGQFLVTWEMSPHVHIWNPENGQRLFTFPHTERVHHVAFSPTAPELVATAGWASEVQVWNMRTGDLLARLKHPRNPWQLQFNSDGDKLVTSSEDGCMWVWDWRHERLLDGWSVYSDAIRDFCISHNKRWLITLTHNEIQISDWRTRAFVSPRLKMQSGFFLGLQIPPGNRRAIVGGFSESLVGCNLDAMLTPVNVPAEDLVDLTELVSGRHILEQGNVIRLTSVERDEHWQRLQRNDGLRKLLRDTTTTCDATTLRAVRARQRIESAVALWNAGKKSQALATFREAVELDSTNADACDRLAFALQETNDPASALPVAEEAVRLDPGIAQAHWNLGRARSGTGDVQGSIAAFREAVRRKPQNLAYQQSLTAALKLRDERIP